MLTNVSVADDACTKLTFMKYFLPVLVLLFCSCKTLRIADEKNARNTPSIGIEWNYSESVNEKLPHRIDSVISGVMSQFNSEGHSFSVHKKLPKDKDYLALDFEKGKVVSKGEKIAGYAISGLGLIVTPI